VDEVEKYTISILLPIGSNRPWLKACLDSLNQASIGLQTELVVILNNLSNQDCIKIKTTILNCWKGPIKIVKKESNTLAEILNEGVLHCSGQLIARIDDDDLMLPTRLEEQLRTFIQNPGLVLVGSATQVINSQGARVRTNHYPVSHSDITKALRFGNSFAHSSVMMSKEALQLVGAYSTNWDLAEDYHLWTKLSRMGTVMNVSHPLTSYRLSDSQLNSRHKKVQVKSIKGIVAEIFKHELEIKKRFYTSPREPRNSRISVSGRGIFNTRLLSRQNFAIARLYADSISKWNLHVLSRLFLSFINNPREFTIMCKTVIHKRSLQNDNLHPESTLLDN
jgi:hypothetical protein